MYKADTAFYLQVFYKNTTNENLNPLIIPNCGVKCPLEKFYDIYKAVIPDGDFETECRISVLSMTYAEADLTGINLSMKTLKKYSVGFCIRLIISFNA